MTRPALGLSSSIRRTVLAAGVLLLAVSDQGCAREEADGGAKALAPPDLPRAARAGLTVGAGGTLLKDGKPYRGIGVNYFSAFYRTLKDPDDTSYRQGLARLARLGIPFARFMACGFWPVDNRLYIKDKARYFELLDGIVRAAEEAGVGLVPSLFWHSSTVPDLVGEPRDAWGYPESRTRAFMRTYVREVVTRYRGSPAIWGWEFGNEYNLAADLPNAAKHRPKIVPRLGTPKSRSARDDLSHDTIAAAFSAFAKEVRRHDPHRFVTTGNSRPRASAWHQWREKSWKQDSEAQYDERLLLDHPDPVNVVSIHIYKAAEKRFGREVGIDEFLRLSVGAASKAGKPLFVGEFGARREEAEREEVVRRRFERILSAIENAKVPLAALWVYDFGGQEKTWNVTSDNARAWQLEAIARANRRIRERARSGR